MTYGLPMPDATAGEAVQIAASIHPLWTPVAVACCGIASFGAFAASSLAVYSPTKLQNRVSGTAGDRLVAELERRKGEYRIMARFYLLGGLIGSLLALQAAVDAVTLPWALAVLGVALLFLCGSLPAAIADRRAEAILIRATPVLRGGLLLLRWPLILPVQLITGGILRVLRVREEASSDPEEIAEDVMAAVADSAPQDSLADEEKAWIGNIVGLKDLQVSTIMTPRPDLVPIQADTSIRDAVQVALQHGFSRYPVYREKVDEMIGVFYVKDALRVPPDGNGSSEPISSMMRPPVFVPETMGVVQLLQRFQADKVHMAIVLDEYGCTAGVVSVEDALEQIVGDIGDEYDAAEVKEAPQVSVVEPGRVLEVSGRAPVAEINGLLGTEVADDGDWETIAGFLIHYLNRIPAVDETVAIDGVEFRVLQADARRIGRLRITALASPAGARHA